MSFFHTFCTHFKQSICPKHYLVWIIFVIFLRTNQWNMSIQYASDALDQAHKDSNSSILIIKIMHLTLLVLINITSPFNSFLRKSISIWYICSGSQWTVLCEAPVKSLQRRGILCTRRSDSSQQFTDNLWPSLPMSHSQLHDRNNSAWRLMELICHQIKTPKWQTWKM